MHPRPLALLVGAVVGLVAVSPVFASDDGAAPTVPSSSTSTTAAMSAEPSATSSSSTTATTGGTAAAPSSSSSSTTTTGPADPSAAAPEPSPSPSACEAPETLHDAAPAEGATATYDAGDAGSVEVEKVSATQLRVVGASPNSGWTHEVTAPSGPRIKVRFKEADVDDPATTRFSASLNDDGSEIHVRVTNCP